MRHYPHHIGDFNNATRHLTRLERSIYRDLMELYYETEAMIPLDLAWVCKRILANDCSTDVERMLNEFFTETPTGWFHSRCDEEIDRYKSSQSQKALAGKASAAKKEAKRQQALSARSTDVEQTNNGASTNQEPRTKNHIKEKRGEKSPLVFPEWLKKETWEKWNRYRNSSKGWTHDAKVLSLATLSGLCKTDDDALKIINRSIERGWTGLFPLDGNRQATTQPATSRPSRRMFPDSEIAA